MDLHEFDLNLLVAFDAIYTEGNLTRGGRKVNLTQSAMSHALRRLRKLLDDPLFVRQGNLMIPTPLAEELAAAVGASLRSLRCALEDKGEFDPRRSEGVFAIGMNDCTAYVLMPRLLSIVREVAPKVRISARHLNYQQRVDALEDGSADLAVGSAMRAGAGIQRQWLYDDREVVIVRRDHPRIGDSMDLDQFVAEDFIRLSLSAYGDDDTIEDPLTRLGLKRRIMVLVENELLIPFMVSRSDYAANVSEIVVKEFSSHLPIKAFPIPIGQSVDKLYQFWHERNHRDPANRWLRGLVKQVFQDL